MTVHRSIAGITRTSRGARARSAAFVVTAAVIAVGVTACAASPAGSSAASASRTGARVTSSPTAAPGAAATGDFPCNVFTIAQVRAATGYDIVRAQPITAVTDSTQKSCEWADAEQHSFGVIAATHDGRCALQVFSEVENTGATIPGFGDAAWGNASEIGVVFGDEYIQVADDSDAADDNATLANIGIDRLEAMATAVHDAMR